MTRRSWKVAPLLFGSGLCALIYQTVWLRQFRLIFGASTAATAAVLAIFMGGLGLGSALLGRRADAHPRPLAFYGNLELMIALSAAASLPLVWCASRLYIALGGSVVLGMFGATVVRLLLSAIVLAVPTVLMGGTLPAAARSVETSDDDGRRKLALLYAANTFGAVTGTLLATFYMLEQLGSRKTLLAAVVVNVVVGIVARLTARENEPLTPAPLPVRRGEGTRGWVLAASAIAGFAFLLMELVWYRTLAPLLGGSTFTFGLILAVALLGIGLGGAAYSFWGGEGAATAGGFALTCSLEAAAMAIPFALGDRLAIMENLLRATGAVGFAGFILAWTILTLIVVFPAAFIAGIQFPLLIALLGRGREEVGHQVGLAYAWNTAGAIAGSLAGGFGLLPLLTAPGCWRLASLLLALLAIGAIVVALREKAVVASVAAIAGVVVTVGASLSLGPTTVWRHAGIGGGRAPTYDTRNALRGWMYGERRSVVWDADGRESSVALLDKDNLVFIVNGKADGSATGDAGTQVMAGLVGALLHRNPRSAMVIGLGTGSTAGWLGKVPSIERVDVAELEPAILRVARACESVNQHVLDNPRVHIRIADAREVLLTTRQRYDIIFSEPSNPFRAGVASLFTREFYEASARRLNTGGIFLQWVQSYEVDAQTVRTIYATIAAVFPHVETWQTTDGDLLLVATREPVAHDADLLRARIAQEPYRSALTWTWRVESVEGFLSHFLAADSLARAVAKSEHELNTDDRTVIEFQFARTVGRKGGETMSELARLAQDRGEHLPPHLRGRVDVTGILTQRTTTTYLTLLPPDPTPEQRMHSAIASNWSSSELREIARSWRASHWQPVNSSEALALGEALADDADENALLCARMLRGHHEIEADAITAQLRVRQARYVEAAALLERALARYRTDPWGDWDAMGRVIVAAQALARVPGYAPRMYNALRVPFAAGQWNDQRRIALAEVSKQMEGCGPHTVAAYRAMEPWAVWTEPWLREREQCYSTAGLTTLATRAKRDLREYREAEPVPLDSGLPRH